MKGITKKNFLEFCLVLNKISQKSFLGICHVPSVITWDMLVQIGLEKAQNNRNELNCKLIESFI
jgi:hypothetical protein